jgi:hypothetical protein
VVAGSVVRMRVPMLVGAISIVPAITPIAADESHGRYRHKNGGGASEVSHKPFFLGERLGSREHHGMADEDIEIGREAA